MALKLHNKLRNPMLQPINLRSHLVKATIVIGLVAIILPLLRPESYFWPYPAIDTRFAPAYSEENFQRVELGMTKAEVEALLGPPLNSTTHSGWLYSEDNAFYWWDYAWLARGVSFDEEGHVHHIGAFVAYD